MLFIDQIVCLKKKHQISMLKFYIKAFSLSVFGANETLLKKIWDNAFYAFLIFHFPLYLYELLDPIMERERERESMCVCERERETEIEMVRDGDRIRKREMSKYGS